MSGKPTPLNQSAVAGAMQEPGYAEPVLGNPVSTLMESGVGNCFPGLEFDVRQLDVRFFPGLVFDFPGVTPAGPDGTQGARLVYADPDGDPLLADAGVDGPQWITDLKRQYAGPAGAALGDGDWYLFWVEQDGKRIEMYDYALYQNAAVRVPYEGETCWWIIRLIEPDKPLTIALSQRDGNGAPSGNPVILEGRRRDYLDEEGMIHPVYHPGELTSSMCSPWTHDFRDCACHYWASNHPDVAFGEVDDPQERSEDSLAEESPILSVNFVDWLRRRSLHLEGVSAQTTLEKARPDRYDPYEINLKWEELDFVLQGREMNETPSPTRRVCKDHYKNPKEMVEDLEMLAGLELTLALEYLYAYFSIRNPDEVTPEQEVAWPGLTEDLRAARQLLLSVALSEMTHLRWVNQVMWLTYQSHPDLGEYKPALTPAETILETDQQPRGLENERPRALRPATPETLETFVIVERPGGALDTEYVHLVEYLREAQDEFPEGLFQLAVRIDSDGMQHYQKFRDIKRILEPYSRNEELYLRPVEPGDPMDCEEVLAPLEQISIVLSSLRQAYEQEARKGDMAVVNSRIRTARDAMHELNDMAEALARKGVGIPFFALWEGHS